MVLIICHFIVNKIITLISVKTTVGVCGKLVSITKPFFYLTDYPLDLTLNVQTSGHAVNLSPEEQQTRISMLLEFINRVKSEGWPVK